MEKKKILIVTPDQEKAQLILLTLELEGYECHYTPNAEEAINEIRALEFHPDLMIVDTKLYGETLSGLGLIKLIKEKGILDLDNVYIILLTEKEYPKGYITVEKKRLGVDEFLTKSMGVDLLTKRVKRALK